MSSRQSPTEFKDAGHPLTYHDGKYKFLSVNIHNLKCIRCIIIILLKCIRCIIIIIWLHLFFTCTPVIVWSASPVNTVPRTLFSGGHYSPVNSVPPQWILSPGAYESIDYRIGGNFRQEKISPISPPALVGEIFYPRIFCPLLMIT